jgi:NCAIR mutase (PurE)-related protein
MAEDWTPPTELTEFAQLDHDRAARRGYPEAIYGEGKTGEQLAGIAAAIRAQHARTPVHPDNTRSGEGDPRRIAGRPL